MAAATLAALKAALARGALDEWLALLPADMLRARGRLAENVASDTMHVELRG
jgi:hypothetical protein